VLGIGLGSLFSEVSTSVSAWSGAASPPAPLLESLGRCCTRPPDAVDEVRFPMLLNVAADSEVGFAHAVSVLVGAIFTLRDVSRGTLV
jgi:hypothetical protein